jgi:hypothetical protein
MRVCVGWHRDRERARGPAGGLGDLRSWKTKAKDHHGQRSANAEAICGSREGGKKGKEGGRKGERGQVAGG